MAYYVEKGETVSGLTLKNDAIYVSSGGTATDTVLNYSSFMIVSKGGSANSATINSGGELHISSGGTATNTLIQSGGVMSASDDDGMWVKSGGVAKGVTLAPSGYLKVYSGGTATNIVENGGYAYIEGQLDGGNPNVKFKSNTFSGLELGSGRFATVHSGTTANDITINYSGKLQIFSNGIANSATVNSGGLLTVFSGGTANDTLVNSGGSLFLSGTANRATVVSEGRLTILSRGAANNTTVEGGCIEVSSGGKANNTVLVSSGLVEITSGGKANSVTVNLDGNMWIYSGGSASDIMANSGGYVCISSGGSAKNIVENGGYVFIADEQESSGYSNVTFKKNSFSGLVLTGDGPEKERKATVHSGTTATNTTVNSDGLLDVLDGIAYDTMVNGGTMHVFYGTANSAVVNDGGYLAIEPDGIANSVTVNSNGTINIMTGASVNSATVNYGGHIEIYSGGTATNLVENGGDLYIEDGAAVTFLPNTFSGLVLNGKNATVHSGTIANDTVVNSDGTLLVYSSGFANGVTVNKDGHLWIYERGLVNGFTVSSGGELNVGYDGWITGRITFLPGAVVVPDTAGCLDFDLTQTTAGATPLVNDLSFISNTFTFTLTVNGMQPDGTYKLAGGAAAFNQTIYVFDTRGKSLGTLTVNGGTLSTPRADYTLKKSGSNLTVDVVSKMTENGPPEPYNNTLYDKTNGVNERVTTAYGTWLSAPNDEIFLDKSGTVSETVDGVTYFNRVGTDDPIDYAKIVLEHGAKLSFHAEATAAATFAVYSLTPKKNGNYKKTKLLTLKLKDKDKDGVFTADSKKLLSLQTSGDYYVSMEFKDKKAGEAFYNVTLNDGDKGSVFYPLGDNTDDWGDMKTAGYGGAVDDLGIINGASLASGGRVVKDEWIGFGDKFDYKKFTLESAAELSFTASAPDGPLKLTICTLKAKTKNEVTTYSPVTVKTVTVKAGQDATLNALRLEAGDYFFKVQSGDIRKSTDYGVQLTSGTFYTDCDGGWNDILLDKKALNENAAYFYNNKLGGNGSICFDKAGNDKTSANAAKFTFDGKQYGGFVGFGDELDFAKLTLTQSADVTFTVTATADVTFEVIQVTQNGGNYTKKSLQTVKYKAGDDNATSKKPVHLERKDGVSYYLSVKATNTKQTSVDPRAYYNVSYVVEAHESCALAMPETDNWGISDALSFASSCSDLLADGSAFDKLAATGDASSWQTIANLA